MAMYKDIDSTHAVQAQRLEETGYSLTAAEREHLDKRHRIWAAITVVTCLGLIFGLIAYPSFSRFF